MHRSINREFGERVATLRREAGFSQAQFASAAGITRPTLASIEAGRQRVLLEQAVAIARAFGFKSLDDLVHLTPRPISAEATASDLRFTGSELSEAERLLAASVFHSID